MEEAQSLESLEEPLSLMTPRGQTQVVTLVELDLITLWNGKNNSTFFLKSAV